MFPLLEGQQRHPCTLYVYIPLFIYYYILCAYVHTHTYIHTLDEQTEGGSHLVKEFYFILFYSPEVLQSTTAVSILHTIQSRHSRSALWIWRSAVGTPWVPFLPEAPFQTRALHCCGCFLPRRYVHWVKAGSLDPAPVDSPGWKSCCWWATVPGPLPPGGARLGLGIKALLLGKPAPSALTLWSEEISGLGKAHRAARTWKTQVSLPISTNPQLSAHLFSVTAGLHSFVNSGISVWVQPSVNSSCTGFLFHGPERLV